MLRCSPRIILLHNESLSSCRWLSAATKRRARHETVQVPCQSNGSITIDVHKPLQSTASSSGAGSVLLYLPRKPSVEDNAEDASNISILQSTPNAHIVKINYRASDKAQFPTPIHDVLAGHDWVVSNLLVKRAITRPGRSEHVGKIAVCGELLGGGLATTLALTECRIGESGIIAAAVNNPITDWVELGGNDSDASTADQQLELQDLLKQRGALFRKPEHYYDPFASPILFFRSAGLDVPGHIEGKPMDDMDELSRLERMEYLHEHGIFADLVKSESLEDALVTVTRRKATRRYPSKTLGLRLPPFRVSGGKGSVLSTSTMEMVMQLRKSYERQIDAGVLRNVSAVAGTMSVDAMLQHEQHSGLGSWDATKCGRARMQQAAQWLAQKLSL